MRLFTAIALFVSFVAAPAAYASDPSCDWDYDVAEKELGKMSASEHTRTREAADAGDPDAQFVVGLTYDLGIGVQKDLAAAREWYRKAAEGGSCPGEMQIAEWTLFGTGGPIDATEAFKWALKLAERGLAIWQINVGSMLIDGNGVPQDRERGFSWHLRAAEGGSVNGMLATAKAYMHGVA